MAMQIYLKMPIFVKMFKDCIMMKIMLYGLMAGLMVLAFMGYCQYYGWYPSPKYYNTQFAFPYVMVNNNPR